MLGRKGKDSVTGFSGIIIGRCTYLTGCDQVLIAPPSKENEFKESRWFDVQRVELLDGDPLVFDNSKTPGPDLEAPIK